MRQRFAMLIGISMFPLVFATVTLLAHHGSAGYDIQNRVTLTGVVTRLEWVNPHSFVFIDVKDSKGHVENWALEGSPPNVLIRTGWTKEMLMPGTEITVIGFPPRAQYSQGVGTFRNLNQALAYSPNALDHLKSTHILQIGDIRLQGQTRLFGMGPSFNGTR